jgi:hypothetical protein
VSFPIFQDWRDIGWGQSWEKVLAESIDNSITLFPIVTRHILPAKAAAKRFLPSRNAKQNLDMMT